MVLRKSALLALGFSGFLLAGCAVTNYDSSSPKTDVMTMSSTGKYNVVSSETVWLKAFDKNGRLPSVELDFLTMAMKNQPGSMYGDAWSKALPVLEDAYGYMNIRAEDTADMKVSTRSSNPIVFEDSATSIPVKVKTVMVLSPEVYSVGWSTSYALTVSLAPMKKYNYGALLVAVTDNNGKMIGTRVVGLYRTMWFSGLLPTALFAIDSPSANGGFFRDMSPDEKSLQVAFVVQAVTEILCAKPGETADPTWRNIRDAVIESLAIGNEDAAVKLLKSARDQKIGGDELKGFTKMMGM